MNTFVLISLYYHKKRDWCRCTTSSPYGASASDEELLGLAVEGHTIPPGKANAVPVRCVDDVEAVAPLVVSDRVGGGGPVNGFTSKDCGLNFLKVHSSLLIRS